MHGEDEADFRIDRMMDGNSYTSSLDAAMTLAEPFMLVTLSDIAA
jgi:hypothetical protein